MDPIKVDDPLANNLENVVKESIKDVDGILGIHGLRISTERAKTQVSFHCEMANECLLTQEEIQMKIEGELKKIDPSYKAQIVFDENYTKLEEEKEA
jgi:divalent metal cation (Fe/Co/Zn/Cd) transporter